MRYEERELTSNDENRNSVVLMRGARFKEVRDRVSLFSFFMKKGDKEKGALSQFYDLRTPYY